MHVGQGWVEMAATPVGQPLRAALLPRVLNPSAADAVAPAGGNSGRPVGAQADGSFKEGELAMGMRTAAATALGQLAWRLQGGQQAGRQP